MARADIGAYSVAVGDVNQDGIPDLIVVNNCADSNCADGSVGVLLGDGNGTFQAAVTYVSGGYQPYAAAVADVNGDDKADLIVANYCASSRNCPNGSVGVLLSNGNGTFQAAVSYGSGGMDGAFSVAMGDVNHDGMPDLIVANVCASSSNCTDGSVGVLLGNADGTFQTAVSYGTGGEYAYSVAVGDVNVDGKSDLVVANECADSDCTNGWVGMLLGNGDGTFQPAVSYNSGGYQPYSVAVGDVNQDGMPDLVVANVCASSSNCANGSVDVLLGNGDGTFQPAVSYNSGGYQPYSVAVGDVNQDGMPDLLVANQCADDNCTNGSVSVLLGNGDGTFQAAVSYSSGGQYVLFRGSRGCKRGRQIGPYCGERVRCSNCTNGSIGVLLGNGDGTFQTELISFTPSLV